MTVQTDDAVARDPAIGRITLFVLALAVFAFTTFQAYILLQSRANMEKARANQENAMQEGAKLRERVQGLAGHTAQLAVDGNANARAIVDSFHRQGVDLKPPAK